MKKRVAFVVQRCGTEVNGGAEALCLQVAQRMSAHWQTEVLTTCALDYMTWADHYPPGAEELGGALVRRFPVDEPRDVAAFNRLSEQLHERRQTATLEEQENWMRAQGPMSSPLFDYIASHRAEYDAFIFFGYLYATTYFGLPLVAEKAFLAPFAHDEWTIHFPMWDAFFTQPRELIFSTPFEKDFLGRRFPHLSLSGPIVGIGIDPPARIDPEEFRARYQLREPFLLYAGRIDESKGCGWLLENFIRARNQGSVQGKLVLLGTEVMPIPFHDDVIHLGFVGETEKWQALAACDWLVMPSRHESLSIILLEAWAAGRPGLVTASAEVLLGHCRSSHGGLWFQDWREVEIILRLTDPETKAALGRQGQRYVSERYSWERIEREYLKLLGG